MRSALATIVVLMFVVTAAQAYTVAPLANGHVAVVEDGAPSNWMTLPWADAVLHTNPVRGHGVAPIYVHRDFTLNALGTYGPNGQVVDYYVTWTKGAHGETAWIRVHPGESTEMRPTTETSTFKLNGRDVTVRMWIGGWFTRCANPTHVVNWQIEAQTYVRTIPGPERIKQEWYVVNTDTTTQVVQKFAFYQSVEAPPQLSQIRYAFDYRPDLTETVVRGLLGVWAAREGKPEVKLVQQQSTGVAVSNPIDIDNSFTSNTQVGVQTGVVVDNN